MQGGSDSDLNVFFNFVLYCVLRGRESLCLTQGGSNCLRSDPGPDIPIYLGAGLSWYAQVQPFIWQLCSPLSVIISQLFYFCQENCPVYMSSFCKKSFVIYTASEYIHQPSQKMLSHSTYMVSIQLSFIHYNKNFINNYMYLDLTLN